MGPAYQNIVSFVRKLLWAFKWRDANHSYSQSGEDLLIDFVVNALGISEVTYLDIGAYHPSHFSNTFLFYQRGSRGVLVEPDPELFEVIRTARPRDICINAGIGTDEATGATFYVMSTRTLNTFSEKEAKRYEEMERQRIEATLQIPMIRLNDVIEQKFGGQCPTFISIDIEGFDYEVLATLDLARFRPPIICVETLTYSESREGIKDTRAKMLLTVNGYFEYADTYINSIFVDEARWRASAPPA